MDSVIERRIWSIYYSKFVVPLVSYEFSSMKQKRIIRDLLTVRNKEIQDIYQDLPRITIWEPQKVHPMSSDEIDIALSERLIADPLILPDRDFQETTSEDGLNDDRANQKESGESEHTVIDEVSQPLVPQIENPISSRGNGFPTWKEESPGIHANTFTQSSLVDNITFTIRKIFRRVALHLSEQII